MKWLYILFFTVAIGAFISAGYLIFSKRTTPQRSITEKKLDEANVFANSQKGWNKMIEFMRLYPGLVKTKEIQLSVEGKITEISPVKITLTGEKEEKLTLTEENGFSAETKVYQVSGETSKEIKISDLASGDRVSVNLYVDFTSGKERVRAIFRFSK